MNYNQSVLKSSQNIKLVDEHEDHSIHNKQNKRSTSYYNLDRNTGIKKGRSVDLL